MTTKKKISKTKRAKKSPTTTKSVSPAHSSSEEALLLARDFQSNLLSLISHELRTPLMGIINSVTLLEEGRSVSPLSASELISIARRNAQRLESSLNSLLDLAAVEAGLFFVRLREIDFPRFVERKLETSQRFLDERGIELRIESAIKNEAKRAMFPVLADPLRLGRALDLTVEVLSSRLPAQTPVKVRISTAQVGFQFAVAEHEIKFWKESFSESKKPLSSERFFQGPAFHGTFRTQAEFLTRSAEGLGSEFVLVQEIMKRHKGEFKISAEKKGAFGEVKLDFELPELNSVESLITALGSRTASVSQELRSVSLGLVSVPKSENVDAFKNHIRANLFRASDAVYPLPDKNQVALMLEDCRPEDAPALLERIGKTLGVKFEFGVVSSPQDGTDPELLLELAERRINIKN